MTNIKPGIILTVGIKNGFFVIDLSINIQTHGLMSGADSIPHLTGTISTLISSVVLAGFGYTFRAKSYSIVADRITGSQAIVVVYLTF